MAGNLRYYVYRSKAKVDMLWEQIDARSLNKYSKELKVNLGFVEAGGGSEKKEATLEIRLQIVLRELEATGQLGDLTSARDFVRGTVPMSWRLIDDDEPGKMVLFSGFAEGVGANGLRVGLVGSAAHVTGMSNLEPASLYYFQPDLWERMDDEDLDISSLMELRAEIDEDSRARTHTHSRQMFEFAAKVFDRDLEKGFLLGSPLYVAQA